MGEKDERKAEPTKKLQVYEILKNRIVNNELKSQEYLNEQAICAELEVSKTPVREALQRLERNHLVTIIPNKGCFVSSISIDSIREVFQVREIFECAAARMAAGLPDKSRFVDMLENHESFKATNGEGVRRSLLSGYQIHGVIVNAVGNSILEEYYNDILCHIVRIRIYTLSRLNVKRFSDTCREHKQVLKAIIASQADKAEQAMRDHLRHSFDSIDQLIRSNREEK